MLAQLHPLWLQNIELIPELIVRLKVYLQLLDLELALVELLPQLGQLLVLEHQLLLQSLRQGSDHHHL